jgi:hypothetical protein
MLPEIIDYQHPTYDLESRWDAHKEIVRLVFPFAQPSDPIGHICEHKTQRIRRILEPVAEFETIDIIPVENPPIAKVEAKLLRPSPEDIQNIIVTKIPSITIEKSENFETLVAESMTIIVREKLQFCANAIIHAIPYHLQNRSADPANQ